jgi:hypothetical protein
MHVVEGGPTDPVVVAAGWSPEQDLEPRLEVGTYRRGVTGFRPDRRFGVVIAADSARRLAGVAVAFTPAMRDMLLAMAELQFDQLFEAEDCLADAGPMAVIQACRELDAIVSVLGPDAPPVGYEAKAREYIGFVRGEGTV